MGGIEIQIETDIPLVYNPLFFFFHKNCFFIGTVEKEYRRCSWSEYILQRIEASLPCLRERERGERGKMVDQSPEKGVEVELFEGSEFSTGSERE